MAAWGESEFISWEEMSRRPLRSAVATAVAAATAAAFAACSVPANTGPATYYLALGDSLSKGVQPNAAGVSVETSQGYPEFAYARLRRGHPTLRLVQLGARTSTPTRPDTVSSPARSSRPPT